MKTPFQGIQDISEHTPTCLTTADIQKMASGPEKHQWSTNGCEKTDGVWTHTKTCHHCLPIAYMLGLIKIAHGRSRMSKGGIVESITRHWFAPGIITLTQIFCSKCLICAQNTTARDTRITHAPLGHPPPTEPFQHWQIEFTPSEGKKYLLCVCSVNGWRLFPQENRTEMQ